MLWASLCNAHRMCVMLHVLTCIVWDLAWPRSAQPWRDHRGRWRGSHHQVNGGAPDGHRGATERMWLVVEPGGVACHPDSREYVNVIVSASPWKLGSLVSLPWDLLGVGTRQMTTSAVLRGPTALRL